MLEHRCVGHRVQAGGVGVHVGVEARENLRVAPFRGDAFVFAAGVIGVLLVPRRKAADGDHPALGPVVGGSQNRAQRLQICPQRLAADRPWRFVFPDIQVKEKRPAGDEKIVIAQERAICRHIHRVIEPIRIRVIRQPRRIAFSGFQIVVDRPEQRIAFRATGDFSGEHRRAVGIDQPRLHVQPRAGEIEHELVIERPGLSSKRMGSRSSAPATVEAIAAVSGTCSS